jgi:predicted hydrocarbon binding protein
MLNPPIESLPQNPAGCQEVLLQILMKGGAEVIGQEAVADLFARAGRRADSLAIFSALHTELKASYGDLGGQGVAVRLGRAAFKYGLRQWGGQAGMTTPTFRLQPTLRRARASLQKLAELIDIQFGSRVELSENATHWFWSVVECPACSHRTSDRPDCHLLAGMLQETLAWAGGGRFFQVRETECSAAGASACLFKIDKKPLD